MGWTTCHRDKGFTNREWFAREVVGEGRTILADSTVKGVYYAAVREDATGETWALVCLTHWAPRDEHNYGWKSQDETMGPCDVDAPAKVLDLLTPTDSEYANAWRERCRAVLAAKAARPKVKHGDLLRFAEPIKFVDGSELSQLRFLERSRFRGSNGGVYRIPRWKDRDYALVEGYPLAEEGAS